jgi:hypothetical protein
MKDACFRTSPSSRTWAINANDGPLEGGGSYFAQERVSARSIEYAHAWWLDHELGREGVLKQRGGVSQGGGEEDCLSLGGKEG